MKPASFGEYGINSADKPVIPAEQTLALPIWPLGVLGFHRGEWELGAGAFLKLLFFCVPFTVIIIFERHFPVTPPRHS